MLNKNRLAQHSCFYCLPFFSIQIFLSFSIILTIIKGYAQKQHELVVHVDKAFLQDFSIKYKPLDPATVLIAANTDRNGCIRVFSSAGVLLTHDGQFLYPGSLRADNRY
jgi:hypothetical protein